MATSRDRNGRSCGMWPECGPNGWPAGGVWRGRDRNSSTAAPVAAPARGCHRTIENFAGRFGRRSACFEKVPKRAAKGAIHR
eukprot:scaffold1443_cov116-Isochrysis_galbana.AAC.1